METLFDLSVTKVIAANRLLRSQVSVTVHRYNRECWGLSLKVAGKTVYYDEMENEVLSDGLHPVILSSDYESIEQVSRSVGYNSIYHFSKMFKQYTGLSPGQYKK